jgi:hypothetical protein
VFHAITTLLFLPFSEVTEVHKYILLLEMKLIEVTSFVPSKGSMFLVETGFFFSLCHNNEACSGVNTAPHREYFVSEWA